MVVPVLVGRAEEQQRLRARMEDLRRGIGRFVIISGPAGIGKTALVDSMVEHAPPEVTVWRATADPFEVDRPLGVLLDALRGSDRHRPDLDALRRAVTPGGIPGRGSPRGGGRGRVVSRVGEQ